MGESIAAEQVTRKAGPFEKRIHEVDFIRGILILIVLFDHLMNAFCTHNRTWFEITGFNCFYETAKNLQWYWDSWARAITRYVCLFAFCFVSGLSCSFSRNNWKRAGEMIVLWFVIFIGGRIISASKVVDFSTCIDFNIIGVLAFSTLFYCFVQNQSWKGKLACSLLWYLASTVLLYILKAVPNIDKVYCPFLFDPSLIGQPQADWMPLLPYIFFFFLGATLTTIIYKEKKPLFKRREFERPICYVGRHTLWIYLGHQAVIIPVFMAVDAIVKAIYGGH